MKIGILGAGNIGATLARHFAKAGHQVGLSNSRGPASLAGLVKSIGPNACAMTSEEAAKFGEVVLLAVPWRSREAWPAPEWVSGKIVIDAMNPYSADGEIMDLGDRLSSDEVVQHFPGARVVKAFNTMYYHTLATEARAPGENRLVLFVAGDDASAKAVVSKLIDEIGFTPVDTGSLREGGRKQRPGSPIYNRPMTAAQARAALADMPAREGCLSPSSREFLQPPECKNGARFTSGLRRAETARPTAQFGQGCLSSSSREFLQPPAFIHGCGFASGLWRAETTCPAWSARVGSLSPSSRGVTLPDRRRKNLPLYWIFFLHSGTESLTLTTILTYAVRGHCHN